MPPVQWGQPQSTRLLSHHKPTFWTQLKTMKKSNEQWSVLISVQCPASRVFLVIFYAYWKQYPIVHLWSNTTTHKEQVLAVAQHTSPTPQTQQNFFRSQSKFLANFSHTEVSLNFSPASTDDPYKTDLDHIIRVGKPAKAIKHDFSVLGTQAFSLPVYQFSTSTQQSTCLKYKPARVTFHCFLRVCSLTAAHM